MLFKIYFIEHINEKEIEIGIREMNSPKHN